MALTLEQSQRICAIRAKVLAGTHTMEELKEGMVILRADRQASASAATIKRSEKAAKAAPVNTTNILADLKQGLLSGTHKG